MVKSIAILFSILLASQISFTQVDTTLFKQEVEALETDKDREDFWIKIRHRDQTKRGNKYSNQNDLENLIYVSYYINKFGYPVNECKESRIVSMVWIHNSFPEVKRLSFPIILQGFQKKEISESELRNYYIRNLYNRKFNDNLYRTKPLSQIFKELELNIAPTINVDNILQAYSDSKEFLDKDHEVIGQWDKGGYDGKIKIFKTKEEVYYVHRLYQDGSHYPQKLGQDLTYESLFRIHPSSDFYFAIQKNGDLTVKDTNGVQHHPSAIGKL